jgi:hypothetical protein
MDGYSAELIAAVQDEAGVPLLAVVLRSGATQESSVFFTKDFTEAKGKERWVFRGEQGGVAITNLAVGHGKSGEALIVITTQQGPRSTSFLVNPRLGDSSWLWREVPSPVDSQRVLSTAIGHNARLQTLDGVDGLLYSLHQADGDQSWLIVTSLPDFQIYNHAIPLDINPTAFGVAHNAQGDTELIVADDALYYLDPSLQLSRDPDQVKQQKVVLTPPLIQKARTVEVGFLSAGKLDVWFLTQDGVLARTYQGDDRVWLEPLTFQAQVGALHAWRSQARGINEVFTIDLGNRIRRYRQDPTTTQWKGLDILVESLDAQREIKTYATQFQITDEGGAPLAGQTVTVRASELTPITINHSVYYVGPTDPVTCQTDLLGSVTLINQVEGLSTPTLFLRADALGAEEITADPASEIRQKLSSLSAEDLAGAQMQTDTIGVTEPLFPGKSADDLAGAHQAVQQLLTLSRDLPNQGKTPRPSSPGSTGAVFFALDLRGPHPIYVDDPDTIHRLYLPRQRDPALPAPTSFIGSLKHAFGDVWHAIKHDFLGAEHFVIKKIDEGIELVIGAAKATYQVVVKYAEQAWSVIEYVLQRVGAFIKDVIRWLGFLFAWKDILRTHTVLRVLVNRCLDKLVSELGSAEEHVHWIFNALKEQVIGQGLDKKAGPWADGKTNSLKSGVKEPSLLHSPEVSWAPAPRHEREPLEAR